MADVVTYVEYDHPGSFFSEQSRRRVERRDPHDAALHAPTSAFAFTFYDIATTSTEVGDAAVSMASQPLRRSNRYFIDGELLTAAGVAALPGDYSILLSNMRDNGWATVVRCRSGSFLPFAEGDDEIVSTSGGAS